MRQGIRLAGVLLLAFTAAAAAADNPGTGPVLAPAWPDDAELEARGTRIGTVTVQERPIFDPDAQGERKAIYRLADRVHIDTRDSVIESQLLFRPGDLYSRRRIDETARNLRELRFIREPEIRIVGYRDGLVDLEVITHEVWSTSPGISFGRSGGENSTGIQLEELNLFGFGKHLAVDYSSDVDRSSYTVRWRDPDVWGSRWRSELALRDSDDGAGIFVALERPFYSLDTRWSAGFEFAQEDSVEQVYRLGEAIAAYGQDKDRAELRFGWSRGLQDGWTRRIVLGLRHEQAAFNLAPGETAPFTLPENRRLDYPFLRLESVQDDFETVRNRDQIERTEDLHFGLRYAIELGLADAAFGADRSAVLLRAEASRGYRFGDRQSLFVQGTLGGRIEHGALADGLLAGGVRYYRETGPRSTFFAALGGELGHALDADHELTIGGDTGLRGYPLRYQNGSSRALLTLEQRYYTNRSLWKLADIGGAVFFDMGCSWGDSAFGPTADLGLLKDIGIGLRLGSTRTARGNVLHIDVAFPLDGPRSLNRAQLLIQTKRSF
ncbi:MAG: hypothetical protein WD929_06245 [Steroidobacteraceae bacterium]